MKYVILDAKGHKLPIIFPEALNHDNVATALAEAIARQVPSYRNSVTIYGAGFCDPIVISVHGKSETLNVESKALDLPYLALGDAVAHMPPEMAQVMLQHLTEKMRK